MRHILRISTVCILEKVGPEDPNSYYPIAIRVTVTSVTCKHHNIIIFITLNQPTLTYDINKNLLF